ncbi:MAG: hypothetical protein FWF59_05765 [Turicibacter sp.]|nr:hypothetical protein [Turicibacter sp.]
MIEKLNMSSKDITAGNIEKIGKLFPEVLTEARDEHGMLKTAINFEKLKQVLSKDIVEGQESYEFTWVGKREAMAEAGRPTTKTLRPKIEDSVNWDTTENLYIEGDNLEALKLLQESYLGKVKMIYIEIITSRLIQFKVSSNLQFRGCAFSEKGVHIKNPNKNKIPRKRMIPLTWDFC